MILKIILIQESGSVICLTESASKNGKMGQSIKVSF